MTNSIPHFRTVGPGRRERQNPDVRMKQLEARRRQILKELNEIDATLKGLSPRVRAT